MLSPLAISRLVSLSITKIEAHIVCSKFEYLITSILKESKCWQCFVFSPFVVVVGVEVVEVVVVAQHCISYAIHLLTTLLTKIGNTIYPTSLNSWFEKQMVTLSQIQPWNVHIKTYSSVLLTHSKDVDNSTLRQKKMKPFKRRRFFSFKKIQHTKKLTQFIIES